MKTTRLPRPPGRAFAPRSALFNVARSLLCTGAVALCLQPAFAQTAGASDVPASLKQSIEAEKAAYAAFKADDTGAALAQIGLAIAARPSTTRPDLQIAEGFARISAGLRNESDYRRAAAAAALALRQIADHQQNFDKPQQAQAARLVAELYEYVLGDPAKALVYYQQAAASDKRAQEGVARMQAIQAALAAKAQENELLRKRQAEGPTN